MNEEKKKRKINGRKILFIVEMLILIALIVVIGDRVYNEFFKKQKTEEPTVVVEKDSMEEYGYKLDDRDTDLYETNYNELKDVLSKEKIDYTAYASLLTKLFIIDFYTLDNKLTSTDIGGLEFIHPDQLKNFKLKAGDTMYKNVLSNLYNERKQSLPEVSEVTLEEPIVTTFTYNKKKYEAYKVVASWNYKEDLGYETSGTYILIKDNNKLYVVSGT